MPAEEVMRRADRLLLRLIQDRVAGHYFEDVDSKKIIRGDGAVTIGKERIGLEELKH